METGGGDERGHQSNQVVVHVTRVTQRGRAGRHYGGDQLVDLGEGRLGYLEALGGYPVQGCVVQDNLGII